jgi:hypothetical protein
MLSDIHLIFGTLLCHIKIQFKFELGFDPSIFHGVMAVGLRKISQILSFPHFFLSCFHLIFGTLLCHTTIQIKFELGFDPLIFHKVMALGLRKISQILSFPHFFPSCFQIFIWYLVHCFAIPRYRWSSNLVLIHQFFTELWPLDLGKYHKFSVFRTFFLRALRYSFDIWYIALPYQDTDQVRVWFWSIDFSRSYGPWT